MSALLAQCLDDFCRNRMRVGNDAEHSATVRQRADCGSTGHQRAEDLVADRGSFQVHAIDRSIAARALHGSLRVDARDGAA